VRLKSALDLGLMWAWAPENSRRGPSGVREPSSTLGFRAVSNRTDHDSRRCSAEFESARRDPPIQHSRDRSQRGSCPSSQSGKRESGEADGALLLHIQGTRDPAGTGTLARTSAIRSGVTETVHALLHSNASVRPRRARRAAGGTPRPRPPATRLRQCVAAEQLRGDDGARLRSLLPQRSGREVGARRDACPSGHETALLKVDVRARAYGRLTGTGAFWENAVGQAGRIATTPEQLELFGQSLAPRTGWRSR
jgi:hypothetical protein